MCVCSALCFNQHPLAIVERGGGGGEKRGTNIFVLNSQLVLMLKESFVKIIDDAVC